ncbi:hypothetical protein DK419_15565 [Methylobacterium terrae]|uniref:Uncharacterized protein n=2 Tax=Methylobacterium terrae TaxID=2202827 RepID=A0A2U8WQ28_9HYPH|nr:hypothetical protein DK419_15565 [Methylobacterium terrae]
MSIGELSALLSVYEQAARAFTRNVFWPELGPHGFCRVDDEAERCASIQRAILDEFGSRSSASDADQADITDPAEASNGRRHQ